MKKRKQKTVRLIHAATKLEPHDPDYLFWCPGCGCCHGISTTSPNRARDIWTFDGNMEAPTITPSVLLQGRCHLTVTAGMITYHSDSVHKLSGQTIPMEAF